MTQQKPSGTDPDPAGDADVVAGAVPIRPPDDAHEDEGTDEADG